MNSQACKLVTAICEPVLSNQITMLVKSLGASGFTVSDVRGEGTSNRHSGEIPDSKIKIEIICDAELAQKLIHEISSAYFEDFSLIVYSSDINVVRAEKFKGRSI